MSLAVLLAARLLAPADASDEPAPLRWVAADPRCPDGLHVREAAEELAGRWPSRAELEVDGFVQGHDVGDAPPRWDLVLTVVVGGRVHRQTLQAESCPALARAAALIIAVSIDPVVSATAVPMPALPERAPEGAAPEEPSAAAVRAPEADPPRSRPTPHVGVGWGAVLGMTPGVSSGPHLSVGLTGQRSRFALIGRYVLPRRADRVQVQAGTVGAQACLASRPRTVRGHLCGTLEAGTLRARGLLSRPQTPHFPWLAAVVGGGVRWRFAPHVSLAVDLEGTVAIFDAQVVIGSTDVVDPDIAFQNPRLGGRGLLGLEFDFSPSR